MSKYLTHRVATLRPDEGGQMAFMMGFALALDAGVWYFDHRTAQNQADAAVLAVGLSHAERQAARSLVGQNR